MTTKRKPAPAQDRPRRNIDTDTVTHDQDDAHLVAWMVTVYSTSGHVQRRLYFNDDKALRLMRRVRAAGGEATKERVLIVPRPRGGL